MTANSRLGAAILALLALSAVGAPAARAASSIDVGVAPAILESTEETTNRLSISNSKGETLTTAKCSITTLTGTSAATNLTSQLLAPTYTFCTLGGLSATVAANFCEYRLNSTVFAKTASMDIVCPAGKAIEIVQGGCVIKIGPQTGLSSVTFLNAGSGSTAEVLATLNVRKIGVTGGSGCPANLIGTANTGVVTGNVRVRAFKDEGGIRGVQVGLTAT